MKSVKLTNDDRGRSDYRSPLPFFNKGGNVLDLKRNRLLRLHHLPSMTRGLLRRMLRQDESLESFFNLSPQALHQTLQIPLERAKRLYHELHDVHEQSRFEAQLKNIATVTIFDSLYPPLLKKIPDPPFVLYCLGNRQLLKKTPSISIIGSRRPSQEGPKKLEYIATPLIKEGWMVVSGLAYGIDRLAHELTLRYDGATIAVLGSGFYHLYPQSHRKLFESIVKCGLVISEYPPYRRPRKFHFPERNRIISGLTKATLVIEAEEKSGTNITVDFALEQGREVYAVPGSILHSKARGCHRMIQEGAKLVMDASDILEDKDLFSFSSF